ncbi:MAG: MATE family efflux transporter [Oligoflexia bacterium]|nr:MATE family efflux transporter [Oligoflexia bacterium]
MDSKDNKDLAYFMSNPGKGLIKMTLPVLSAMLIQNIYHFVDIIYVSRISTLAISSLAYNFPVIFLIYGIAFGLGSGLTALVGRNMGAENHAEVENIANHGLLVGFASGLFFSMAGLFFSEQILLSMGIPPELLKDASDYFFIISFGFVVTSLSIMFRSVFVGEGNTKLPMIILGAGAVLNIILDPVFIFLLDMGLKGAALATVFSQLAVISLFCHFTFRAKALYVAPDPGKLKIKKNTVLSILGIGLPASMSMIVMSMGAAVFNYILAHYSSKAIAGFQVAMQFEQLYLLPVISVSMSVVALAGMFYGARRKDLLLRLFKLGVFLNCCIGLFCSLVFYFASPEIFRIFTGDPYVIGVADSYIKVLIFAYPFTSMGITSGRFLQGLGSSVPLMLFTFMRVLFISAPLAYIFAVILSKGMEWIWYSMLFASICSSLMALSWLLIRLSGIRMQPRTS